VPFQHRFARRQRPQGGAAESDEAVSECGIHFLTDKLQISVPTAPRHYQQTSHKPLELFFSSKQLRSK